MNVPTLVFVLKTRQKAIRILLKSLANTLIAPHQNVGRRLKKKLFRSRTTALSSPQQSVGVRFESKWGENAVILVWSRHSHGI